jgi:mannose-6-phosphate isomerase
MPLRKLEPKFVERVWGSTELEPWFPNPVSGAVPIGEVWHEVPADVPLLVKFLFTKEPLSIQVHPGDEHAQKHHGSPGKTEMWHILRAEPSAKICAGFRAPVSAGQVRAAAESPKREAIEEMLEWFDAAPEDTFFIPAGVVHAIGAGLVLCEIQQPSDVTYRIFDYGRGRELHLDRGLGVAQFGPYAARTKLPVTSDYFVTSRLTVHGQILYRPMMQRAQLLIAIHGEGEIDGQPLKAGDVWHVPGDATHILLTGQVTLLRASVPPRKAQDSGKMPSSA